MYGMVLNCLKRFSRDLEISRALILFIMAMTRKVNDKGYILNISPVIVLQYFINLISFMAIAKEI